MDTDAYGYCYDCLRPLMPKYPPPQRCSKCARRLHLTS
jgi:hypothetical protein